MRESAHLESLTSPGSAKWLQNNYFSRGNVSHVMPFFVYLKFIKHRNRHASLNDQRRWQVMDKETEELVKKVKKELRALRAKVDELENHAALMAYEEMTSTLD
jgi:ferritin